MDKKHVIPTWYLKHVAQCMSSYSAENLLFWHSVSYISFLLSLSFIIFPLQEMKLR